jgi:hypothetical protein
MDNGLIFPYPRRSAPDQARCANQPLGGAVFGPGRRRVGPWRVVVKRWGDAGR